MVNYNELKCGMVYYDTKEKDNVIYIGKDGMKTDVYMFCMEYSMTIIVWYEHHELDRLNEVSLNYNIRNIFNKTDNEDN